MMGVLSNYIIPVAVSVFIHAFLFWLLGASWEPEKKPNRIVPPKFIEAKLVQLEDKSKTKASAEKKPVKIDLAAQKRAQELEQQRVEEVKRQAKIKQEKEAAAKKEAENKKREQELAQKKKAQELAQKKKEQELAQKKKEQELAASKAREQERRKAEERRLQQEFEAAMREEQGMLREEEYAVDAQSFAARFRQRVESNWSRPPAARTGMRCVLAIQLVPTGRIVSVNVVESSGNAAFDRSAIQAVQKVEVFTEVKEMKPEVFERYYRNFKLLFDPQDLRL